MAYHSLDNLKEHPCYVLGRKTTEICAPLFNNFPVNHFDYAIQYFENNTSDKANMATIASGDQEWLLHYLQSDYNFLANGRKIHSWASVMSPKALADAANNFNHHNGIILEKVTSEYIEFFGFSSPSPYATPLEFCGNKELVNQFILYFKYKARNILKIIEKEPILFPKSRFLKIEDPMQPYIEFSQAIRTKKACFRFKSNEIMFSHREYEVLSLLIKGQTMKQVAKTMHISPRTVETYLQNTKNKTTGFTTEQLLENFRKSLF